MECRYYCKTDKGSVRCNLCPHKCQITLGSKGLCSVRHNENGILKSEVYGITSGISFDPVEKKPLYHFFPGMKILSVGSYGCNLTCSFCQNHNISQVDQMNGINRSVLRSIESIVKSSLSYPESCGIAFTYNEPTVWYEFMFDIATIAKEYGQKTAMISNGFINPEPLKEIVPLIDAFNIDLKAFSNNFYRHYSGALLKPVLNSLCQIKSNDRHLEITMLIIEGLNDNPNEFKSAVKWIAGNLGKDTPLHISRYFPRYKLHLPSTSLSTLTSMYSTARECLEYVYIGNIPESRLSDTICPSCNATVTIRSGYETRQVKIGRSGECNICGKIIYREFTYLQ